MITIPKPEEIKTWLMTSDADFHKSLDFTMDGESPADFTTWQFQAVAKIATSDPAPAFNITITPSLVTVAGVQTAQLAFDVDRATLAELFVGADNVDKKLTANLLYKQPGVDKVLLAAFMSIKVVRGTTTWTP